MSVRVSPSRRFVGTSACAVLAVGALILVGAPRDARAQESRNLAFTILSPSAIGVTWHVSERIALRPDVSATHARQSIGGGLGTTYSSGSTTIGLAALIYGKADPRSGWYLAPRIAATRQWVSEGLDARTTWRLNMGPGVQRRIGESAFTVLGEAGVSATYLRYSVQTLSATQTLTSTSISTYTTLGISYYF